MPKAFMQNWFYSQSEAMQSLLTGDYVAADDVYFSDKEANLLLKSFESGLQKTFKERGIDCTEAQQFIIAVAMCDYMLAFHMKSQARNTYEYMGKFCSGDGVGTPPTAEEREEVEKKAHVATRIVDIYSAHTTRCFYKALQESGMDKVEAVKLMGHVCRHVVDSYSKVFRTKHDIYPQPYELEEIRRTPENMVPLVERVLEDRAQALDAELKRRGRGGR